MEYIIEAFGNIPLASIIIMGAAIGTLLYACIKAYKFIVAQHDFLKEREEVITEMKNDLRAIKETNDQQNEKIRLIQEKQDRIEQIQERAEAKSKEYRVTTLRNKLLESYNYYTSTSKNPMQAWTEMEKDAFDAMFREYEKVGGNGYMHSTVQPAMASLGVVRMSDSVGISRLMVSRQG